MSEKINDGGSAFPCHGSMGEVANEGMTLRDYFAAKALAGMLAAPGGKFSHNDDKQIARDAYVVADSMLAAREVQS